MYDLKNTPIENILSIYGSHDAGAVFTDRSGKLQILEYERFVKRRYAMFSHQFDELEHFGQLRSNREEREAFIQYIVQRKSDWDILYIIYEELDGDDIGLLAQYFPKAKFIHSAWSHHRAHAASAYYSSPFTNALIISYDGGGGEDGRVVAAKTYHGIASTIVDLTIYNVDLGTPYAVMGMAVQEISQKEEVFVNLLTNSGKMMGLCAYGKVREEWVPAMRDFYWNPAKLPPAEMLRIFSEAIELPLKTFGVNAYDLAATSQHVFETLFFETFWPEIEFHNRNVVLTGGCALNVLLNQKLKMRLAEIGKDLFIPCCPGDSGLALGMLLYHTNTRLTDEIVFNGMEITDEDDLVRLRDERKCRPVTVEQLADRLIEGKIIGIIEGQSEVGPRALGHRSIICLPNNAEVKQKLNDRVKFREWFRPFAPVCPTPFTGDYFHDVFDSPYMSYAPTASQHTMQKCPSIVHADGTARLQTFTLATEHPLFFELSCELMRKNQMPILLNTSFNIKGQPILSSYKDALYVLDNTALDHVYSNGYLFSKKC